jgi:ferredoxin
MRDREPVKGSTSMGLRADVDKDSCISSGRCVADAPGHFRFDDDEISEVIPGAPPLPADQLRAIALGCPAEAIRLFEGDQPVETD